MARDPTQHTVYPTVAPEFGGDPHGRRPHAQEGVTEKARDLRNGGLCDDSYDETGRFIRPANRRYERIKKKRASRKVRLPGSPDLDLRVPEELED